ncbi:MAG: hypothetical protein ETSY1_10950 [Candidatus Entotheonella factor]|uniref:Glyoxalase/fosfomycin resistance/dioxygenase domain-containing protein n=1 Tax=Entotheonella factor TaxID=1429438 RepID=W4LS12_ENTF1|nr:VOC family protein [Candidatus Entotheonella palauensis]ETX00526.1 MAG: hypothetical protein ETSY1_10950 [Candidatus Entotheonella factor]
MSDPRPDIAIGHVRLDVSNVADSTAFFVKLGIRTIVEQDDFSVLELRGGTHLVLRNWEAPESSPVGFDIMVDDIDAAYAKVKGYGMEVSDIRRGRIHDNFEVQTPDHRALTINSSHAGDRAV